MASPFVRSLLTCLALSLAAQACKYKEVDIVDFRLFLNTKDAKIAQGTIRLVDYYNLRMGAEKLKCSMGSEGTNSAISWTAGLRNVDGKLGFGQWQTETRKDDQFSVLLGNTPKRTIKYSMNIEFDQAFFVQRMNKPVNSPEWQELFVLFCHEVGHGLTMNHDEDSKSVMFKYIDGAKGIKFDEYFSAARAFFAAHQ